MAVDNILKGIIFENIYQKTLEECAFLESQNWLSDGGHFFFFIVEGELYEAKEYMERQKLWNPKRFNELAGQTTQ